MLGLKGFLDVIVIVEEEAEAFQKKVERLGLEVVDPKGLRPTTSLFALTICQAWKTR